YKTYLDYTGVKDGATRTLEHFSFPISHNAIELTSDENNIPIISLSQNNSGNKVTGIVYDGLQNSSKLAQLFMLKEYSRNYDFEIISADMGFIQDTDGNSFVAGLPIQLEFELNKIDEDKDA